MHVLESSPPQVEDIYKDGRYLEMNDGWHREDSAWKASQIAEMLKSIDEPIGSIVDVGCGAGEVLTSLAKYDSVSDARMVGYDISPQAIEMCQQNPDFNIDFRNEDALDASNKEHFDVLLAIDVFEHVPDYLGFLEKCQKKATYKIYHIPLDIHVSSVMRRNLDQPRRKLGHLHYFSTNSAKSTLEFSNHEILNCTHTSGALDLFWTHPSIKRAIGNVPRWLVSRFNKPLAATLCGGFSLLVLTK